MHAPEHMRVSLAFWTVLGSASLLSLVALFAYAPIFAVDFFWLLKLGEVISETRAIPQQDLFSAVHPERHYVQFQWLWEWLVYQTYAFAGLRGVRWFQVLTLSTSFLVLGVNVWRLLRSRVVTFCFCALALVLFEDRFQARPSATVLGFVAVMLPWLVDATRRDRPRTWLWVFAVACVWSNVHGGESLLMVLCFGALAVGSALELRLHADSAQWKRDLRLLVASAAGVVLSPAFFSGMRDWSRAIAPQLASGNKEWRPSYTMLENGLTPSYAVIGLGPTVLMVLYVVEQRYRARAPGGRSAPWGEWLLSAGLFVLAQLTVRNAFLCLVPLCFMLQRRAFALPLRTARLLSALGVALLGVAFQDHVVQGYGGVAEALETLDEDLAPQTFPEQLADFMHEAGIEGGILNDGRWGGYLLWRLWPSCHVFVDTRHDLTPEMWPVFLKSHVPRTRPAAMESAFSRWGVELAVFRGPTFPIIIAPAQWQLLYKSGDQELYQRRGGKHAATNVARAKRWLESKVSRVLSESEQAASATEVGADVWLSAPAQQRLHRRAVSLMLSPSEDDQRDGLFMESELLFDAGRYAQSFALLDELTARPSVSAVALYRYALSAYVVQASARSRWALERLAPRVRELTKLQAGRLSVLEGALRSQRAPDDQDADR